MLGGIGAVGRVGRLGAPALSKGGGFFSGLDLDFVANRYALNGPYSAAFPAGWSFSRTGAGTAETAAGALVSFATGVPRITDRGLLVEEARTNLLLNSAFAGGGTPTNWSASGTPTAGARALLPSVSAITFAASASRVWIVQAISVAAATAYAVAVNVESVTGTIVASQVIGSGLGSGITWPACQANPSGGTSGVVQPGRLVAIITPVGTSEQLRFGAGVNSNQTATVVLSLPQLELGSFPTSPIITTGSAATRGVDAASIVVPANVSTYTATYGSGLTETGPVTPGASLDLVTARPWLNGYLRRLVMQ